MIVDLRIGVVWAVLALACVGVLATDAGAEDFRQSPHFGAGMHSLDAYYLYELGRCTRHFTPVPPYFALHPPVYYSVPVPRTYGYSPFAYPPGTMTPEVIPPGPKVIENRFVPTKAKATAEPVHVAVRPLRITNPFVVQVASSHKGDRAVMAADGGQRR